jgi:raffinose/stachyose/melibiose transport system permease protein
MTESPPAASLIKPGFAHRGGRTGNKALKKSIYPVYFSFGALILYSVFYVLPGLGGIVFSFTDWHQVRPISKDTLFVGLQNFMKILSPNEQYFKYIWNTLVFTFATVILKNVIGLVIALLLNSKLRGQNVYRGVVFLPVVFSVLSIGIIFNSILNPQDGILNIFLRSIGFDWLAMKWLVDVRTALLSVIMVDTWKGVGYIMVIYLAGLQAIPSEFYEAAAIDGASYMQKLFKITLPMIIETITVTTVLNLLYGLRVFDIVYIMTKGGPGSATDVMYTAVFKEFGWGNYAVGSALASVMFVFMAITGYFAIRLMTKREASL